MKGIFFPRLNSKEGYKELIEGVEKPPRRLLTQTVLKKKLNLITIFHLYVDG